MQDLNVLKYCDLIADVTAFNLFLEKLEEDHSNVGEEYRKIIISTILLEIFNQLHEDNIHFTKEIRFEYNILFDDKLAYYCLS